MTASTPLALGSPWPHRFALMTAAATLPLLFIGGLVTSMGAGLAVPDWPTTFGYNMFTYPWSKMVGGIFYEHSHRLFGSLVGFLTIVLALSLWRLESRTWLRWLGVVALGAVIFQGALGGLRVVLLEQNLAILHACFAQMFFAFAASIALFTSPEWSERSEKKISADAERIQRLGVLTIGFLLLQLILGAFVRHRGEFVGLHIGVAFLVALHTLLLANRLCRYHTDKPFLAQSANRLRLLLIVQLALGLGAFLAKFTTSGMFLNPYLVLLATSHVVVGALMLATSVRITLRSFRFLGSAKSPLPLGHTSL